MREINSNPEAQTLIATLLARRTPVSTIRHQIKENYQITLTKKDVYNMGQKIRYQQLGGKNPIQWLVDELEKLGYFFQYDTDEENRVTRFFFAHPQCIKLLKQNPDIILMDCTYKTNRFNMPLVNIYGSAGNNMTPQIACAFLGGEKEEDYTWVLIAFIEMCNKNGVSKPRLFVTDRELALLNSIDNLFLTSDHILCRWHVNMNVVAKTKKHFKTQEDFDSFYEAWIACLDSQTLAQYVANLESLRKHKAVAVKYVEQTWLLWREKIVCLPHPLYTQLTTHFTPYFRSSSGSIRHLILAISSPHAMN